MSSVNWAKLARWRVPLGFATCIAGFVIASAWTAGLAVAYFTVAFANGGFDLLGRLG